MTRPLRHAAFSLRLQRALTVFSSPNTLAFFVRFGLLLAGLGWLPLSAFASSTQQLAWVRLDGPISAHIGRSAQVRCVALDQKDKPIVGASYRFFLRRVDAERVEATTDTSKPPIQGLLRPRVGAERIEVAPDTKQQGDRFVLRFAKPSLWEVGCVASWNHEKMRALMPLSMEVLPNPPHQISVDIFPKRQWYRMGERVSFRVRVLDRGGYPHDSPSVRWESSVKGITPDVTGLLRLTQAGRIVLTASLASKGKSLQTQIVLQVDEKPPVIELFDPIPHAMLSGDASILLRGRVVDQESGLASFVFLGRPIAVDAEGHFVLPYRCRWGLNLLSFVAVDRAGHTKRFERSFLYAPRYLPDKATQQGALPPFFSLQIAQSFLDRGPLERRADVLTLLEDLLNTTDLGRVRIPVIQGSYRIPPVGPTIQYRVEQRAAMQLDRMGASLRLFRDGFWLDLTLRRFVFPLDVDINTDRQRITVDAQRVRFSFWFQILRRADGRVHVEMSHRFADLSGLRVNGIHGLLAWFRGTVEGRVRDGLRDGLSNAIRQRLIPVIQRRLQSLPLDLRWRLPPVLGGRPMRLLLDIQALRLAPEALSVALGASLRCEQPRFPHAQGTPLLPPQPTTPSIAAFSSALSVDAANQVLYALWQCGVFQRDLSRLIQSRLQIPQMPFALPALRLRFVARLPPIIMPGDARYPFAIALGGFRVHLDWSEKHAPPSSLLAEISLVLGARATTNAAGELLLILAPRPLQFQLQILQQSGTRSLSHEDWAAFLSGLLLEQTPDAAASIFRALPLNQDDPFVHVPPRYRPIFRALRLWPRQVGFDGQRLLLGLDLHYQSPNQSFRTSE